MARDPAITFRGALRILGHYDRPWLKRLDVLLGGVILAAGGIPAVGAIWGWVDQKNEATGLLQKALDAVSNRLTRTGGLARHELVIAAHTTLVWAAFFETLREQLGRDFFTTAEKITLATGDSALRDRPLIRRLYDARVPAPTALWGFAENVAEVEEWAAELVVVVGQLFPDAANNFDDGGFVRAVGVRYRSDYLRLATTVPEFKVWSDLGEHAATRTALARLADLLTQSVQDHAPHDLRALVGEINRTELTLPVIDVDVDGYGIDAVFPTVERIFLTPRFRIAQETGAGRVGDEHWWADLEPRQDLDVVLARHFSTPGSMSLPMLLLGHPGAGKSLLMKVLAARLPESTYTVVRVPLRRVDADANVSTQVQQALELATNGRVSWPALADQSADTIRVIILDGLDELLQATSNDRAGYLTDIVEFQRIEAALGKPVAVVVTSRTLVADRVRVPRGTPVLKLEEFDEDQIREWLRIWNEVNGDVRPVTPESVLAQPKLAAQPLLLLMLTLYFADPAATSADADLSTKDLYQRLFDTYARREVTKQAGRVLSENELDEVVDTQLSRLSVAALGMFNRGRQSITEAELSADLNALGEPAPTGQRVLGEFFFIHAPEATAEKVHRGYEFLHATFGEYLVATKVVEVLADIAEGAFGRRRRHDPDDELLFALLSHQPLAIQRPTLDFIRNHFAVMAERADVIRTLELLIPSYRHRRIATRYTDYRPQQPDTVRALAAYSANLVLLRLLAERSVELNTLWPDKPNAWPAMVNLWSAGLDAEGYRATLSSFARFGNAIRTTGPFNIPVTNELDAAKLKGDVRTLRRLSFGHAVLDDWPVPPGLQSWMDDTLGALLRLLLGYSDDVYLEDVPESVPLSETPPVAELACGVIGLRCPQMSRNVTERCLRWLMRLRMQPAPPILPLALAERTHPGLLDSLRANPDDTWTPEWRAVLRRPESVRMVDVDELALHLKDIVPDWRLLSSDTSDPR